MDELFGIVLVLAAAAIHRKVNAIMPERQDEQRGVQWRKQCPSMASQP
jgi:hypothetical protein